MKIIKNVYIQIIVIFSITINIYADVSRYRRAASLPLRKNITPIMVKVTNKCDSILHFTYEFPEAKIKLTNEIYEGVNLAEVEIGNALKSENEGEPVLPVIPVEIVIPAGYSFDGVSIIQTNKRKIEGNFRIKHGEANIPLVPGATPRKAKPINSIYQSNNPYPLKAVEVVGIQYKRGIPIAILRINPIEYYPKSGKLNSFESISFEIRFKKYKDKNLLKIRPQGLSSSFVNKIENPEALESYSREAISVFNEGISPIGICNPSQSFQYVIVTVDSFVNATTDYTVRDLVAHKQSRGITATIVTMEQILANYSGVDNAERLRNFIIDAYNNWETDFILLGGDINIVPMRKLYCTAAGETDLIPSDLYFQCLDGNYNSDNDSYWGEPTDGPNGSDVDLLAEVYIGRASAQNCMEMSNFVYKTIKYETDNENSSYLHRALMVGEYLGFGGVSEYATASMEEIRLGSSSHGYTTVGFASCQEFTVDTLYDRPGYSWPVSEIINRMNSGNYSIYNHLGHANYNYVMKFYNSDADALTNNNFFFAYSQGCIPGDFERDCVGEHLTTSTRHGAYAVVFNSRYGWGRYNSTDGPSQRFNRQFWDAYFGELMTNLGVLNADSHEDNIWDINGTCIRWCLYETNLLGDPHTSIRGRTRGPVLQYSSHNVSDSANGNNDGIINPGETIDLILTIVNIGTDSAQSVNAIVSSSDPYVTITKGNTAFGTIQCCGAMRVAFTPITLTVSPHCPTPHSIALSCQLKDNRDSMWISNFTITVYSSSLVKGYVRSFTGGIPIRGATVSYRGPVSGTVSTNDSGAYSFGGIDGVYEIVATAEGYLPSLPITVTLPPSLDNINFNLTRPLISIVPSSLYDTVNRGDSTTSLITIFNRGDAILNFTAIPTDNMGSTVMPAESLYDASHFVELSKDEYDDRKGYPVKFTKGGPDRFGYRWYDSDEQGGPTFQWVDIRTTGSLLSTVSNCDDCYESRELSFSFPFYGREYSTIYISSNGYCTFERGSSQYSNYPIPSTSMPPNLIAGFFDDLYPGYNGNVYFQDFGNKAIIQFTDVSPYSGSGSYTFQIVIEKNGVITFYYHTMSGILTSATVGIQNGTRDDGLQVVYNSPYLKNNFAVRIIPQTKWMEIMPQSGTINPGDSTQLTIKLNSRNLNGGLYRGSIVITHNDPTTRNPYLFPCSLYVKGIRRLSVSPTLLNFGSCLIGDSNTMQLVLTNAGDEPTLISSITVSNSSFRCESQSPFTIPSYGNAVVNVRYSPTRVGTHSGILTIYSNAEDNPVLNVSLSGEAFVGPSIFVIPQQIIVSQATVDSTKKILTIANSGDQNLFWNINKRNNWILVTPAFGSTLPNSISNVEVFFNPKGLIAGVYYDTITIIHNGTNRSSPIKIPIVLQLNNAQSNNNELVITNIGISALTDAHGRKYTLKNIIAGSPVTGIVRGNKYSLKLR